MNYYKILLLSSSLLLISCDQDPISGLERGWIWNLGNKDLVLTLECTNSYTMQVKLYDGRETNEEKMIQIFEMESSEIKELKLKKSKDYTLYVKNLGPFNRTHSKNFKLKKSCTMTISQYGINGC